MSIASPPPARGRTTPSLLRACLIAIWVPALLFFLAALAGVRSSRNGIQTIGKDAVPSILAAESLKVSLSDLDANVVNELIVPPGSAETSSIKGYVARRQEITVSLIRSAENITYGDLERKPITDLTNALSAYERLAIKARTLHERHDEQGAIVTYRDGLVQLHEQLLPAADALAKANTDALDRRGAELDRLTSLTTALTVVCGVALLAALLATQLFLTRRTRRTLNPPLLVATILSGVLLALLLRAFAGAQAQERIARDDAFASLSALWQARAISYDANSDESRWLFDRDRRPELERAFFAKSALVLKPPTGMGYDAMTAATAAPALPAGTTGFLAQELQNITFAGEQDLARQTVQTYGVYYAKDGLLRSRENAGQHAEAVRFDISMAPGDSNWAFSQFDTALGKTIDVNQQAFDTTIESGFARLRGYDIALPILTLLIGGLAFAGIRPRLREYDV